jgi:hypothetical protein
LRADAVVSAEAERTLASDEQQASGNELQPRARFLRNAIANEAAAPSSFEARERID